MIRIFSMKVAGRDFTSGRWAPYLSEQRLREAQKRKNPVERQLFLGAEILLNRSLEAAGVECPRPAVYERNIHGKPFLTQAEGISVNWSHSGAYAVCAVADTEIGIDLQETRKTPGENLIRRLLQPREKEFYRLWKDERKELFYEYWVLKESFLKALGTGFAASLEDFYIEWETGLPRIVQELSEKSYSCCLLDFREPGYRAAVCREGAAIPKEVRIEYF